MRWTGEKVLERIELGEDGFLEFKQAVFSNDKLKGSQRDDIADELAAMGNADGGNLIFSVSDAGKVLSLSREQMDALEEAIYEVCNDKIKPSLLFNTQRVRLPDGSHVLVVEVAQSNDVHKSRGRYWFRQGSAKREMPTEVLARLMEKRSRAGRIRMDEQTVAGTGINTLEPALYERLLSSRTDESVENQLHKLGLIGNDANGKLCATVTGILLCAEKPEMYLRSALIQAVSYRGTSQADQQIDAKIFTGPLDRQIKNAVIFVVRNMRISARKDPARVDMPQYSDRVIFEAIVNAVVHRDYSVRGSKIRLFMFDDRLELYSPGSLNNSLTIESMRKRQSTRNETIASMLGMLPTGDVPGAGDRQYFLERRGEGILIIHKETKELTGRQPDYQLFDDAELLLTIPAAPKPAENMTGEVSVSASGQPLGGVRVHAIYPNKTWQEATTDSLGRAHFDFHSALPMTVFCAAPGYAAGLVRDWHPPVPLELELNPLAEGGSVVFPEDTGHLPGLQGGLNPILDTHDRTYLYASNIAIGGGKQQPVHFKLGEPLLMQDADGNELIVRVIEIIGGSSLLEYETPC